MIEKEIFFESSKIILSGTLSFPQNSPSFVIVMVAGSGPQDRNSNICILPDGPYTGSIEKRNLFLDESKIITNLGGACFRYDKRGCGKSGGDFCTTGFLDFVADAKSAIAHIKNEKDFVGVPIGILGQSEGGLVAISIASENKYVDFAILQAPNNRKLEDILRYHADVFNEKSFKEKETLKKTIPYMFWVFSNCDQLIEKAHAGEKFYQIGDKDWSHKIFLSYWKQSFDFDSKLDDHISKIKCPVLLLHGDKDMNVPIEDGIKNFIILQRTIPEKSYFKKLPNLDHSFKNLDGNEENLFSSFKKPLAPSFIEALEDGMRKIFSHLESITQHKVEKFYE